MRYLILAIPFFLASCKEQKMDLDIVKKTNNREHSYKKSILIKEKLENKTIDFLWRKNRFDQRINDSIEEICINISFCKTISEPEKAALGYVATFIGSDCNWDGDFNDDRNNLKCKILTALNLGYQCSEQHLGFLRKWFKEDKKVLKDLETCPTTPYTATSQNTFIKIRLIVKGKEISVYFEAIGVNTREEKRWAWNETNYFYYDKNQLKLIKKKKSNVKYTDFF
jgi:hypothetical protein